MATSNEQFEPFDLLMISISGDIRAIRVVDWYDDSTGIKWGGVQHLHWNGTRSGLKTALTHYYHNMLYDLPDGGFPRGPIRKLHLVGQLNYSETPVRGRDICISPSTTNEALLEHGISIDQLVTEELTPIT